MAKLQEGSNQESYLEEYKKLLNKTTQKWESDSDELDQMMDKISDTIKNMVDKKLTKTSNYLYCKQIKATIETLKEDNQQKLKRYNSLEIDNQTKKEYLDNLIQMLSFEFRQSEQAFITLKNIVLNTLTSYSIKVSIDSANNLQKTVDDIINISKPKKDIFDKIADMRDKLFRSKKEDNSNKIK